MKTCVLILDLFILGSIAPSWAQLRPPNDAGVTMGEWYTIARDVDSAKRFWILLGGKPTKADGMDVVKFPGVLIFIKQGQPSGGTEGTVIDHVGLHSPNGGEVEARLKAASIRMGAFAGMHRGVSWGYVYSPDDVKIEILDSSISTAANGLPGVPAASPLTGSITCRPHSLLLRCTGIVLTGYAGLVRQDFRRDALRGYCERNGCQYIGGQYSRHGAQVFKISWLSCANQGTCSGSHWV